MVFNDSLQRSAHGNSIKGKTIRVNMDYLRMKSIFFNLIII